MDDDDQLKQSLRFDLQKLEKELTKVQSELNKKIEEYNFMKTKIKGFGTAAGALSGGLGSLLILKNPALAKEAGKAGATTGGKAGLDIANAALAGLQIEIERLQKEKENITYRIEKTRDRLEN